MFTSFSSFIKICIVMSCTTLLSIITILFIGIIISLSEGRLPRIIRNYIELYIRKHNKR